MLPNSENTTLVIAHISHLVSSPWATLLIRILISPYNVSVITLLLLT